MDGFTSFPICNNTFEFDMETPPEMLPAREAPMEELAGFSVIAFGVSLNAFAVASWYLFDAATIDVLAFVAIGLGIGVLKGSHKALRWSIGLMAFYAVIAAALLFVGILLPQHLLIGSLKIPSAHLPWAMTFCACVCAWGLANIYLLFRVLRRPANQSMGGHPP